MNAWLIPLLLLLGGGAGFVARDVLRVLDRTDQALEVDLTRAAARGELLRLDWGDARGAVQVSGNVPFEFEFSGSGSSTKPVRRLRSVE